MADEPTDVASEITPEQFEGEDNTAKAEPSPAIDKKPEVVEKPKEEAKSEKAEAEPEEPKETESPEAKAEEADKPAEPQTKADERKSQLNTEIRDLVSQRNALKEVVTKANSEVYQPATEQELQDEGLTATDARVEALRQQIEVKDYNDRVADAQLTIESESQRVLQDFPVFNPDSSEFDEELSTEAAQLLEANLILDPNTNQVIGSNVLPYQLYKTLARASGISAAKGEMKGQQNTERQLANVDANSSSAPPKKAEDPLSKLWADPL